MSEAPSTLRICRGRLIQETGAENAKRDKERDWHWRAGFGGRVVPYMDRRPIGLGRPGRASCKGTGAGVHAGDHRWANKKWADQTPCSRPSGDPSISASATDGPFIQLGGTALSGTTSLGTITISGSFGSYTGQTITVTGPASIAGAWTVNGFDPTNDEEIYGLAATTTNLTALINELQAAVAGPDPGATVTTVQPSLASVLAGDNIEVVFPNNGVAAPNIFSYNLQNNGVGATITSITVVPEPAVMGTLVVGLVGMVSRRAHRAMA